MAAESGIADSGANSQARKVMPTPASARTKPFTLFVLSQIKGRKPFLMAVLPSLRIVPLPNGLEMSRPASQG
jgi:hypothetical protein